MKYLSLILFIVPFTALADNLQDQSFLPRSEMQAECKNNKKYLDKDYNIQCELNYHHYNSSSYKKNYSKSFSLNNEKVKIAEFNALHPGMGKSRFKDYSRVAKIINQYDVVGVTELIPLVERDLTNNNSVIEFLESTPKLIKELAQEIKSLKESIANTTRSTVTKKRRLALITKQKVQLEEDLKDARSIYRTPGYLKILDALHTLKDGETWSLILAPQGEGSESTPTLELVGYYYRSSKVKPKNNDYCEDLKRTGRIQGKAKPVACIVQMDQEDMGEDKRDVIARRPFLAEFISGRFSFTLLTSHVLFDEPNSPEMQNNILHKAFGVDSYLDLKEYANGATKDKYARFAEVKMTLDFVNNYLNKYGQNKDVIFMGDFNLEKSNPFWSHILKSWSGSQIYIDGDTSVSISRYKKDGSETMAASSNYDHFIFNPEQTSECLLNDSDKLDGGTFYFSLGRPASYIDRTYKVRNKKFIERGSFMSLFSKGYYEKNEKRYNKAIKKFITPKTIGSSPILTISKTDILHREGRRIHRLISRGIVVDETATQEYAEKFKERILDSQFSNSTYYKFYAQLVSDHYPIFMSCDTN
jgi:endonuclease/exonuclease/phosphatase family metal-dependent hydrolase